jgi:hypothetical protein
MPERTWWSRARALLGKNLPEPQPDRDIELTADGFEVRPHESSTVEAALRWDEIQRIRTYKLDLLTVDCICLLFERAAAPPIQISEEWNGFVALMEEMRLRFPGIPADWYESVMQPPFERNEATLY